MIDAQIKQSEKRKNEISAEINKNRELLQSQAQIKRNIDDNIDYRKKKAEVEELSQQIELYEQNIIQTGDMYAKRGAICCPKLSSTPTQVPNWCSAWNPLKSFIWPTIGRV